MYFVDLPDIDLEAAALSCGVIVILLFADVLRSKRKALLFAYFLSIFIQLNVLNSTT
jgi:hypothetical protein